MKRDVKVYAISFIRWQLCGSHDLLPPLSWRRVNLINAHLKSGAIELSATDWMASPAFDPKQGNTYAIFVIGGTYDELKVVFDKLAEGAEKERFQELHDMPFGTYGQFYDKYGVQWIFKGEHKA